MNRSSVRRGWLAAGIVAALGLGVLPGAANETPGPTAGKSPVPLSIDKLTFSPDGELFIADNQGATLYAVDIDRPADAKPGMAAVPALDKQVAAVMGVGQGQIYFTDMAIDPKTGQAYVAAVRQSGQSALFRVDGSGRVSLVSLEGRAYSAVTLPNPPPLTPGYRRTRATTVTSMAYQDGALYVAGLSNEEFSSKLRVLPYPFRTAGRGAGIEIFHTSHGQYETESPVYTLLPMQFEGRAELLAAYICTPMVRLPVAALKDGAELRGTTIAEMGRHNRPIDMVRYSKDGQDFILLANSRRGLLKVPVAAILAAPAIPDTSSIDTHDLGAKRIREMDNVDHLALADAGHFAVLKQGENGVDLQVAALP